MKEPENEKTIVERDWTTKAGLRAVVLFVRGSHRCGYVGVAKDSNLHGKTYNQMYEYDTDISVHGGLTYSDSSLDYPVTHDGLWWFGFDCAHSGDATRYFAGPGDVLRSLDYCVSECESMAEQLMTIDKSATFSGFNKQALDYLSDATSQPQIVAKVARLMERQAELDTAIKAIRASDCGGWLKDCSGGLFSCSDGAEKRRELMRLLDKLYKAAEDKK